jgi:phospholipid/cholesterol/gamma-HCH transport system permease protein
MKKMAGAVGAKMRYFRERIVTIAGFSSYAVRSFSGFYRRGFKSSFAVILRQIKFTGVDALPITMLIALLLGSLVMIQAMPQLSRLGASEMIGKILVIAIIRELGPLITAIVVIARSGTAISAELGTSVVLREIEALEAMGINPFHYTIVPRIIASVVALFCLTVYFDVMAIFGGFLIASAKISLSLSSLLENVVKAMSPGDLLLSVFKSMVFGAIIPVICCYYGLAVRRSPTEIPRAVTRGVITSLILVFVTSFVISYLAYI